VPQDKNWSSPCEEIRKYLGRIHQSINEMISVSPSTSTLVDTLAKRIDFATQFAPQLWSEVLAQGVTDHRQRLRSEEESPKSPLEQRQAGTRYASALLFSRLSCTCPVGNVPRIGCSSTDRKNYRYFGLLRVGAAGFEPATPAV